MAVGLPINRSPAPAWRAGASSRFPLALALLVASLLELPARAWAAGESTSGTADDATAASDAPAADELSAGADGAAGGTAHHHGSPEATAGVPSPAELESAGAVIGTVLVDNQNIFNLEDPKDNNWLFRLGNHLHPKTRAEVIRHQLLFRPGDHYNRHLIDESERILRADGYFYDAWIREVRYEDNHVDLRVTTRDVWTLNPGLNFSRSGGTNSVGVQLEDSNFLGSGASVKVFHSVDVDRT